MNITGIQTGQILQNAINSADRGHNSQAKAKAESSSVSVSSDARTPQVSEQAIIAGISFLKQQLDELLNSYPPFFPVGSYQRLDLIKGIKTLEEKIGKSAVDENIKKIFSGGKLSDDATDAEISASLDKLFIVRDKLAEKKTVNSEPVKHGSFLDVKV